MKKFLALLLAMAMVLSLAACGSSGSSDSAASADSTDAGTETAAAEETSADAISDLVTYELTSREMETLNMLYSQNAVDLNVLTNCFDGLLTNDSEGKLSPCLAESWETEDDGHTWTFHLREDACWVNQAGEKMKDLTAQDFLTGLEWVLNAKKNEASNTSMPIEMIEGASEYYDLTDSMSDEEALALTAESPEFADLVGIEAVDDYTLVYTCIDTKPYFDTVSTYCCLYPAAQELIDELGVDGFRACTIDTMWYSGPYILTEYIQGNEKILEQNPLWWGADEETRFNSVTIKMVESQDNAVQLFESGEIDNVTLTQSALNIINDDESNEFHDYLVEMRPTKYAYDFHFCYEKLDADGNPDTNWNTAIANEAFRLCWYYGLDLTEYYSRYNPINPTKCENDCYTMTNLVFTSDGTDYTDLVKQNLGLTESTGEGMARYDADKFAEYKAQAMEELSAKGVTFPVVADYYISASNQTALDTANVLKDIFSECFGDDFITLNICTYVSSLAQEVRTPQLASFYINGWGADYGDPMNFVGQEIYGEDNAYYAVNYSKANSITDPDLLATYQEFTDLVQAANAITDDLDARYEAFAEAEAYMIQHALVVPLYYDVEWELTNINDYTKIYSVYGCQAYRYVNWETNVNGYTTADYEAIAAQ